MTMTDETALRKIILLMQAKLAEQYGEKCDIVVDVEHQAASELDDEELVSYDISKQMITGITSRGIKMLEMLLDTPLPVVKTIWVDPRDQEEK